MTWVVGAGVITGYAVGLSDIRVTLADGSEKDCLQKIYPVGPNIAAAFAGSVAIGFAMIQNLSELLHVPDDVSDVGWDPGEIAEKWPAEAKRIFASQPGSERTCQSQIMLLGVHPTAHNGNPAWPRTEVYTLRSPEFLPIKARPYELPAIGLGASLYEGDLRNLSENNNDRRMILMQGEVGRIGGMGTMLAFEITEIIRKHQPTGISSHLHLCYVFLDKVVIKTNDHLHKGRWKVWNIGPETEPVEEANFKMPRIAKSYQGFMDILDATGESAHGAVA